MKPSENATHVPFYEATRKNKRMGHFTKQNGLEPKLRSSRHRPWTRPSTSLGSFSFCFLKCSILCCLALGLGLENNESCQKRSSLGVGADGGCSHQSCRLVCVPWHGTRCTSNRRTRSSMPETILFPIWPCALVSQSEHDDS